MTRGGGQVHEPGCTGSTALFVLAPTLACFGSAFVPGPGSYLDVSVNFLTTCALRNDHRVVCQGNLSKDLGLPSLDHFQVLTTLGSSGNWCGARDDGHLLCIGWDDAPLSGNGFAQRELP